MKKYLYTLLFMAVALFSATMLSSCGDDDEPASVKSKFTLTFEINTNDPKVKESAEYKAVVADMQSKLQGMTKKEYYLTDAEVDYEWGLLELEVKGMGVQAFLDANAKLLDDTTLSCSLKLLKNGNEWKSLDWKTWYKGY